MSRRGRPPSDQWRDADEAIGHACAQLMHWGYSARSQAFPAVASAAGGVLGRIVSPERVKQIYELWTRRAVMVGYREPGRFTKASRAKHRPEGTAVMQAEELMRGHCPGSLERRKQIMAAVKTACDHDRHASTSAPPHEPDALDDPKWFDVGGGTHPDDMNAQQRVAFDALPPQVQSEYLMLLESDARRVEKDNAETRERWTQWGGHILRPLDAVDRIVREHGFYPLPGLGVRYVCNEVRGKVRRKKK